jgi:hypothetical protein
MQRRHVFWHKRFRTATFLASAVAMAWTLLLVLPFDPFDGLLSVMILGGAGTWLLLGYVLYVAVGVFGFASLSALVASVELDTGRTPNPVIMTVGLVALFAGVNASCLLLGLAGGVGGYAQSIQDVSGTTLQGILEPYLDVTRVAVVVAVVGAAVTMLGIAMASRRGERLPE